MAWLDKLKGKKKDEKSAEESIDSQIALDEADSIAEIPVTEAGSHKLSWFNKIKSGLSKTRKNLTDKVEALVKRTGNMDEDFWEELEEILIQADVGVKTSINLIKSIRTKARKEGIKDAQEVLLLLREQVEQMLQDNEAQGETATGKPHII